MSPSVREESQVPTLPRIGVAPPGAAPADPRGADYWVVHEVGAHLTEELTDAVAQALADRPGRTCLYTDLLGPAGPIAVGGWSVTRARHQDYTGPVMVVSADLLTGAPARVPVRLWAPRAADEVRYLPQPLVAVERDEVADLDPVPASSPGDVPERVSVVIPTRGSTSVVRGRTVCLVDHLLERFDPADPAVELVLVVDTDCAWDAARWAGDWGDRLRVVTTDPPFNFSAKINAGVAAATGEVVVLLNDDIEPITRTWLTDLAALAREPGVGAVGAVLLYEDGTVQHRGHVFGGGGVHLLDNGAAADDPGPRRRNQSDRDVTGVTAACLAQRRSVWVELGGLDPAFPVAFNDVDYCERIRAAGYRVVLANSVRLHHFESRTRPGHATEAEVALLRRRWAASLAGPDPLSAGPLPVPPPAPRRTWAQRLTARWRRRVGAPTPAP